MDPREKELLTGMGNCFAACGEGFERTVEMVAESRHRTPEDVKETLEQIRRHCADEAEYRQLRARLPAGFRC